jgi:Protein of unknown function (DUF4239)
MSVVYGVLVVGGACLAAIVGLTLVQRLVPVEVRQRHNDVAGFIYAVVGIVYAVLLALVVIAVWEEHEAAKATVHSEANEVADIFWLARRIPEPDGLQIQELARSYARVVVDEEWPLMEQSRSSPRAWVLLDEMQRSVQDLEVRTQADQVLFDRGLEQVQQLADSRRIRLVEANEGLPASLWVVLIVGGIVTVGFTYLFGLENTGTHRLMVASLTGMIALVLFTIGTLDYPFSGGGRIGPEAFELVLHRFETSKLNDL